MDLSAVQPFFQPSGEKTSKRAGTRIVVPPSCLTLAVTRLLLLRHAESEWNAQGRWQGLADPPLSERGCRQAVAAGRQLAAMGFTTLAASDLRRARATAALVAPSLGLGRPIVLDPGLREYDVGEWSGLTRAEIDAGWPNAIDDWRNGRLAMTPGGERRDSFEGRIVAAVFRLASELVDHTVLVITHGGVIAALERTLGAEPRRLAHLSGRWIEAGGDELRAGEEVALLDAVAAAGAGRTGRQHGRAAAALRAETASFANVKVEVVRSARRRKTVQAREVGGVLRVSIPATMTKADEDRWVAEMVRRMERRTATGGIDLPQRAEQLATKYKLSRPASIRWATNQEWRWGSCTPSDGAIRISSRLAAEPSWVLDYVIVHELAHLDIPRHDAKFWTLVNRYPKAERARGFLIARGLESDGDSGGAG